MRRAPLILAACFLLITLARVAAFAQHEMQAGWLGWAFSIGLGAAVYTASYWTRNVATRRQAVVALAFFVVVDCYLNFAHVWLSANTSVPLVAIGAILYGLFPTAAVALLGWLSGAVSKLPPDAAALRTRRASNALQDYILARIGAPASAPPAALPAQTAPQEASIPAQTAPVCTLCGASYKSKAAHMRWQHPDQCKPQEHP